MPPSQSRILAKLYVALDIPVFAIVLGLICVSLGKVDGEFCTVANISNIQLSSIFM